jgi:LysM repeat protein
MKCPVCNKTGISLETTTCPECGSDLEAVIYITHLGENLRRVRKNLTITAIVVAVTVIVLLFRLNMLYHDRHELRTDVENVQKENKSLKSSLDSLKAVVKKPLATETGTQQTTQAPGESKTHVVKSGDSLWKLAQQYLGDGNKYPKIASDNNLQSPYLLREGQELKIITSK